MRAEESPAMRRMLRIMEPAPARAGQSWTASSETAESWPDERPELPDADGLAGPSGLPGPRLALDRRAALAVGMVLLAGLLVCIWLILRPGPSAEALPARAAGAVPVVGAGSVQSSGPAVSGPGAAAPSAAGVPLAALPGPSAGVVQGEGISVYVVGAVRHPGVVRLAAGTRVVDAVEAAGGATSRADLTEVNLARKITDGEQILVPRPGQAAPAAGGAGGASGSAGGSSAGAGAGTAQAPLNLNTATESQFDELPGVGPVIAGRIVAWRQQNGQFTRVEQLGEVDGIGDATLQKLSSLVTV